MTTRRGLMKSLALLVALAATPAMAWAAPPKAVIGGPTEVQAKLPFYLDPIGSVSDRPLKWTLSGQPRRFMRIKDDDTGLVGVFVPSAVAGAVYEFKLVAVGTPDGEKELDADAATHRVVVGDPAPSPTPPAPTPTPTPTPPGPNPPPTPTPTPPAPVMGFRVLLVAEPTAKMSRGQLVVLNSTKVVDYLNRKTVKGADGRASWRKFDPDVDVTNELPEWKEIWTATKPTLGQLPVVVLFSGQAGKAYPLPETEAAMLDLLRSYGGP